MPITQARLLRLLEAAEEFTILYDGLCQVANSAALNAHQGRTSWEEGLKTVCELSSLNTGAFSDARHIIAEERTRYRLTHSKNAWDRVHKVQQRDRHERNIRTESHAERLARIVAEGEEDLAEPVMPEGLTEAERRQLQRDVNEAAGTEEDNKNE